MGNTRKENNNMRKQTLKAAVSAAAICVAAALPSWANTAVWKSNADGYLSVASNWVDDYVPQTGDTIDFSAITSTHSVYNDLATPVTFETLIAGNSTVIMRRRQEDAGGGSDWVFNKIETTKQLPMLGGGTPGSTLRVLDAFKYDGPVPPSNLGYTTVFSGFAGNNTIVVDKMELSTSGNTLITSDAVRQNLSKVIVGDLSVYAKKDGYFGLSTVSTSSGRGVDWIVGEGGMSIDGADGVLSFFAVQQNNNVVIHPSADFTVGPAVGRTDNMSILLYKSAKLVLDTTDYNDGTTPRTITLQGSVGARNNQSPRGTLEVMGCGTVDFTGLVNGDGADMAALTVQDTATILVKDTSVMGAGNMTFNSGTTLKVEQTSPSGIVEHGGVLTLAANSTLEFDLAANSATSALKVASLALPASGTINVKLAESDAGRYALVENLPSGTTVDKFSAVNDSSASSYLSLHVEGDKLVGVISKKAIWKSNADGDLSVASNWVDDYVPQAGDTIDFRNVTARHSVYNDLTETVQYETVINHSNVMFRRREGCSDWCFAQVTFDQSGSNGGLGGGDDNNAARLTVAGRITLAGAYGLGTFGGNDIVTADEIMKTRSGNTYLVNGALRTNLSVVKARQFVQSGSTGFFALGTYSNSSNYGLDVVVGSGGFKTSGELFFAVAYQTTVIHPSADYSFEANSHADNAAMVLYAGSTLKIHTTDYNDGVTPRTVTLEGGVAARKSGSPYGKLQILGTGVVDFSSCRESSTVTMPETTVSDTATILVRDTSIIGNGAMLFASGTTLKVVQTSPTGIVELGGALTLAANSTLEFDFAENSATSVLKVASLTMPASGKVRVKASGVGGRGNFVLIDNLPAGINAKQFELVQKPFNNATLVVRDNQLILGRSKGLVIIIAGGRTSGSAPVTAKILFAGDSTLDDHGRVVDPYASWGTTLEDYMRSGCSVDNYAKSGATTKSFRANGYWSSLLAAIRPGDYVGIQFGHNDQKAGSNFAAPDGLFRDNVRQFVSEVRALGGKPILLSPIVRGTFDSDGNLYETQLDNGTRLSQYATAMRELSVELGTDFVDMNALTHDLLVEVGKDASANFFAVSAGVSGDYTHPIPAGADAFARLFIKNVKDRGLEVAALFT